MKSNIRARNLDCPAVSITLRAPVILIVLAATAIPIELRPPGQVPFGFDFGISDTLANIVGYMPIGLVLGGMGSVPAVIVAAMVSTFAEASQFAMVHRVPQVIDVAANVVGAVIGTVAGARWKIQSREFSVTKRKAIVAALLVVAVIVGIWAGSGDPLNPRGTSSPGILEAYWKLDERGGKVARDSAAHSLDGRFHADPVPVAGMAGGAVKFDGRKDYIGFGHSTSFRLTGSMTISAWVNSASFPVDDAAIVSSLHGSGDTTVGYQLDTTVDRGLRTIGFKLGDACGQLMARYGATPLVVGVWYHIAGVYDAEARTLDVYLNGELDNGFLLGRVSGAQRSSRSALYVGRRSDSSGFELAGSIDAVRIYSRALTKAEIAGDMRGTVVEHESAERAETGAIRSVESAGRKDVQTPTCAVSSDREDAQAVPIAAAAIGVLAATACLGLFGPTTGWLLGLAVSLAAGFLLLPATSPTLPALNLWLIPLTTLAGAASVAVSLKPPRAN